MEKEKELFIKTWFENVRSIGFFSSSVSLFIACQFALESDYGRSNLSRVHKNFSGMKVPHRRCFYGFRIESSPFAGYDSISDCLRDYVSWIFYNRPLTHNLLDLKSFMLFLRDSGYCPEKDYINRIYNIYNQFSYYGQTK